MFMNETFKYSNKVGLSFTLCRSFVEAFSWSKQKQNVHSELHLCQSVILQNPATKAYNTSTALSFTETNYADV